MLQEEFERAVKRRVWQYKRSKLMRKKIAGEYGNKPMTKEEAQDYIARIPEIAKEEYLLKKVHSNIKTSSAKNKPD